MSINHPAGINFNPVKNQSTDIGAEKIGHLERTEMPQKEPGTDANSNSTPILKDEYRHESPVTPIGLYHLEQDENGKVKVIFDDPQKADAAKGANAAQKPDDIRKSNAPGKSDAIGKSEEQCTTNTDKVDREIEHLKEEKRELEHQLKSASQNTEKTRQLEQKLARLEQELAQKDNDAYRRQNASVSS